MSDKRYYLIWQFVFGSLATLSVLNIFNGHYGWGLCGLLSNLACAVYVVIEKGAKP